MACGLFFGTLLASVIAFFAVQVIATQPDKSSTKGAAQSRGLMEGDAGPKAVIAFYNGLLQDKAPSIEQERAVFDVSHEMRREFAQAVGVSSEDAESQPVVFDFFRAHLNWFTPRGGIKSRSSLQLSSSSWFYWNLDGLKGDDSKEISAEQFVIVIFDNDPSVRPTVIRTLIFPVKAGKIADPENVRLGGFDSETVYEHLPVMQRWREGK